MDTIKLVKNHITENDIIYLPFMIGLNTGMRTGEVFALTWNEIDLNEGVIKMDKIVVNKNKKWEFQSPKTQASYRCIKIGNTLSTILKRQKTWQKENQNTANIILKVILYVLVKMDNLLHQ